MKRRRKRKIAAAARIALLLLLPSAIAAAGSGIKALRESACAKKVLTEAGTPSAEAAAKDSDLESQYKRIFGYDTGSIPVSEGYGTEAETTSPAEVKLKSPLEMRSDSPGAKPYPEVWSTGGSIVRNTYQPYSGDCFFDLENGGQVNNKTDIPNEELMRESRCLPNFTVSDISEPQVLIYHTHTTESFEPFVRENYDTEFNYRTTDETKNVVMVGDAIQAELEAQGIGVIHIRTIHDYPSYNGSYGRSRESILPVLEEYPSIKVALDIHRDAISGDGIAYQPFIKENDKEAAQIMIISGCDDGTLDMPNYMKNFHFACALQQKLESDHKGLTRPILFDYRHYNQDLTTGSLLIEVGSHCNTLEQVQYSGQLFGRSLGELLCSMKRRNNGT
jgi:stage II sporulation protein P